MSSDSPAKPKIAVVIATVYQLHYFMVPHMKRLGEIYDVTLFIRNDVPKLLAAMDIPVTIKEIPIRRKIAPLHDLRAMVLLWFYLWKGQFLAAYTITPKAGLLGTLAGFLARTPVRIHTFQGEVWVNKTGLSRRLFWFLDWLVAQMATHVVVVSKSERQFLEDQNIIAPGQAKVLGAGSIGGVDIERFAPDKVRRTEQRTALGYADDEIVFLFIGRLDADKGLSVLVDGFEKLNSTFPKSRLLIVGPDEGGLGADISGEHAESIQILPFTDKPEDMLIATDILVLPSFREGFGVVALEAAAVGIPSIGSDIYGITDAIQNNETGLLFEVRNTDDLARKMAELAAEPDKRHAMGQAGRRRVETQFSQTEILDHFMQYFKNLNLTK